MSKNGCSNVGIHHVGLYVKDPLVSAQFYQDILGMQTVGGTPDGTPDIGASAFLSSRPGEESHGLLCHQPHSLVQAIDRRGCLRHALKGRQVLADATAWRRSSAVCRASSADDPMVRGRAP